MYIRTLLYACSPLLLALALSSCSGGTTPPIEKPTLGQPTLENPDAEGEELVVNIPVTGSLTLTLSTTLDGAAASVRSSGVFLAQAKNYVGHVTLIKQRTTAGDDWTASPSESGDMDFSTGSGGGPHVLHLGFEDYWGGDEVNPDASSRDFTLTVRSPGLNPVFIPVKPKKYKWDASIKKTVTTAPVAGGSGEFALNIVHNGPSSATILPGQLKVMDPVLAPLTLNAAGSIAANAPFWTCLNVGNILVCKNSFSITTSTVIPPIKVLVNAPAGSEQKAWTNCGYIRSYDKVLTNNKSCVEGNIKPGEGKLDFAIKKELVKPLILGSTGAYTLTVLNVGGVAAPAPTVQVVDTMPAGLTLNPSPPTIPNWDCSASTPTTLSCKYIGPTPAQIVPSASSTLTFTVDVAKDLQGEVKNCARVRVDGDVNPQNDESCIVNPTTPFETPKFDVTIKKTTEVPLNSSGQGLFLLQPTNAGPGVIPASTPITVVDPIPAGLTLNVALANSSNLPNWNCSASTSSSLNCTYVGSYPIPVGAFAAIQVPVQLNPAVGLAAENCARILAPGESNPQNNFSCTPIVPPSGTSSYHVTLAKTYQKSPATGQEFFVLQPTNAGPGSIPTGTNIVVNDPMPSGIALIVPAAIPNVVTQNAPNWNCAASTASNLSCTYTGAFPVAPGTFSSVLVPFTRVLGVPQATQNCATIQASGDALPNDVKEACADIPPLQQPIKVDLVMRKTQENPLVPGTQGQFTLSVINIADPLPASSGPITVTDSLPAGLTLNVALANSSNLPDWNCSASTPAQLSCTANPSAFVWASSTIKTLNVPVQVSKEFVAKENCAFVSIANDISPNNNNGCTLIQYQNPDKIDVSIDKKQESVFVVGQSGSFTLTVKNDGEPLYTGPITVTDSMPTGFILNVALANSSNLPDWNCSASTTTQLSCTYVGAFPVPTGALLTPIKVPSSIAFGVPVGRENCASVELSGDVDPSDNRKCITLNITSTK